MQLSPEIGYIAIVLVLFVVPRALQRFGVPPAISSLVLGGVLGAGFGLLQHDTTVHLLATFGIVALFLFAGLEVDTEDLRANAGVLAQHLVVRAVLLFAVAFAASSLLQLDPRAATLLSLALLTPSTGFIIDALPQLGLNPDERRWVKSKAIASELLALLVLFATLGSMSLARLGVSVVVLAAIIVLVPLAFRAFATLVVPFAPRSEFAFLLMIAIVCAYATRELGVYYLVGAFVVGMAAQRFRERLPALASESMIHAVEMFASFFVPFYFFNSGLQLRREDLDLRSLAYGAGFIAVMVPIRVVAMVSHRRLALREGRHVGLRIAIAVLPTLVFGLVIGEILRDRFQIPAEIYGGLVIYTLVVTILPAALLRQKLPEFAEPHAPQVETAATAPPVLD